MICKFQNHVRCYRHKEQRRSGGLHRGSRAQCDCRLLEPTRIVSEGKERRENVNSRYLSLNIYMHTALP